MVPSKPPIALLLLLLAVVLFAVSQQVLIACGSGPPLHGAAMCGTWPRVKIRDGVTRVETVASTLGQPDRQVPGAADGEAATLYWVGIWPSWWCKTQLGGVTIRTSSTWEALVLKVRVRNGIIQEHGYSPQPLGSRTPSVEDTIDRLTADASK